MLPLREQLPRAKLRHDRDLEAGFGSVWLPGALAVKFPGAPRSWGWQWVFPSATRSISGRPATAKYSAMRRTGRENTESDRFKLR